MELNQAIEILIKTGSLMVLMLIAILVSILILGLITIAFVKASRWIYVRIELVWGESKESILENKLIPKLLTHKNLHEPPQEVIKNDNPSW